MDMDIVVKDLIQKLRLTDENIFIAGGFVRDHLMGNPGYRDVDVFLPIPYGSNFINTVEAVLSRKAFGESFVFHRASEPDSEYPGMSNRIPRVYHCAFYGIPLDLIPYQLQKGEEPTPETILSSFDFGINQCSYDGVDILQTDACKKDMRNFSLTLTALESMDKLPKIMYQANRLCAQYGLVFQTDLLELKKNKGK